MYQSLIGILTKSWVELAETNKDILPVLVPLVGFFPPVLPRLCECSGTRCCCGLISGRRAKEPRGRRKDCGCDSGDDLNTCRLQLSSDQSSLCQTPLPAGNFSTHLTPSLSASLCPFSFSLSLRSLAAARSLRHAVVPSVSKLLCVVFFIHSASPYLPQCFHSHYLTRSTCSCISLAVISPGDITI